MAVISIEEAFSQTAHIRWSRLVVTMILLVSLRAVPFLFFDRFYIALKQIEAFLNLDYCRNHDIKVENQKSIELIIGNQEFQSHRCCGPLIIRQSIRINPLPNLNRIQNSQNIMLENKPSSFISKLNCILKTKKFNEVIALDQQKGTINIFDKEKLEQEILPDYFRHNKLSSFIRQLNLYGFKKIKHPSITCFSHPILLKGKNVEMIRSQKNLKSIPNVQAEELSHSSRSCQQNNSELYHTQRRFSDQRNRGINLTENNQVGRGAESQGMGLPSMQLGSGLLGWSFGSTPMMPYFIPPVPFFPVMSPLMFNPASNK